MRNNMKKEKNKKKLVLSKVSIAQLDKDKIKKIEAGVDQQPPTVYPPCPRLL